MPEYFLTPDARQDWAEILEYIASDSLDHALKARQRFLEVFRFLGENPYAGHARNDLTRRPVRFFPVYTYLVIYLADTDPVEIVRILSATRDLLRLLD